MKTIPNPTRLGSRFRDTTTFEWLPLVSQEAEAPLIPNTLLSEKCADELASSLCSYSEINSGALSNEACLAGIVDALRDSTMQLETLEINPPLGDICAAENLALANVADRYALTQYCAGKEAFLSTCLTDSTTKNTRLYK